MVQRLLHPRLRHWAARGVLAIIDQGLFAGTNFILNVLLARWLTVEEYGTFAIAYSIFLFFVAIHTAAFVEPMLVFGPGKYSGILNEYLGVLIRGHFLVMVPVSLLLTTLGISIGHWSSSMVGSSFVALALTVPFLLLMWLLRRAFYVGSQLLGAICGGALYLMVSLALLFAMRTFSRISTERALLIMSLSGAITSVFLILLLRLGWRSRPCAVSSSEIYSAHWRYGRWSLAAALVSFFPLNIYYLVLPAWSGLEGTATLRALMNLINPALHILVALAVILLPTLVRHRRNGGIEKMNKTMTVFLFIVLMGSGFFSVALWMSRSWVLQLLYGGRYQEASLGPILFLLLSLLATCCTSVLGVGLMALERPDKNLWSYLGATLVALLVGLPMTALRGVQGAAEGMFLSSLVAAGLMFIFYRQASCAGDASERLQANIYPEQEEPEGVTRLM